MTLRRRELLAGAVAVPLALAAPARAAGVDATVELLGEALRLEQALAVTYERLELGDLAAHERDHAAVVAQALEALGAPRPPEVRTEADVEALRPGLERVRTRRELEAYAAALERAAIDRHVALLRETDQEELIGTITSILPVAGIHLAQLGRTATL